MAFLAREYPGRYALLIGVNPLDQDGSIFTKNSRRLMHDPTQNLLGAPPGVKQSRFRAGFVRITICLNLLAHLLHLYVTWSLGGVGLLTFVVTVFYIPILNGSLALAALVAAPFLKRQDPYFSLRRHLDVALGVPLVAVIAAVIVAVIVTFLYSDAPMIGH